jgi:hypothetical protein
MKTVDKTRSYKARLTSKDKDWTNKKFLPFVVGKYAKGKKTTKKKSRQTENLQRVGQKIGAAIMTFYEADPDAAFHADDLRDSVRDQCGKVAPASSDRVLRDLRKKGKINYEVTNRRKSLYQFLPVTKHATYQPELFTLNH